MDSSSAERFRRADAILDAALDLEPAERAEFVMRACRDDPDLREDVERLLRAHDKSDVLFSDPAADFVAPLLTRDAEAGAGDATSLPDRIGPYRIEREIGRGGMGVVYLAEREDPDFRQRVALKVVRASQADSRASVARFLSERQLLASMEHPHIARLFDGGVTADGLPYYTMAYCEGGSLAERLRTTGALPPAEALRIARQLASALSAAHARGVVHRDVKPANVLFGADGSVRLTDFGVAKLLDDGSMHSDAVVGTVAYLAPEQLRGDAVDHRTDLWALGVTLYEMAAGRRPFEGQSYAAVMHGIVSADPVPVGRLKSGIPPGTDELIGSLLEKNANARPTSAEAVITALDRIGSELADASMRMGAPTRTHWRRRWVPVAIGSAVALLAMVAGAMALRRTTGVPAPLAHEATTGAKLVAVLPFANVSGKPEDEPFTDGLTDELIGTLAKVPGLRVTARSSVFALKGSRLSAQTIADTLGVDYLLDGSVRRDGDRLRVFAQLAHAREGSVLWSEQYDGAVRDELAVQQDMARAISLALRVQLALGNPLQPATDAEAHELYLKGRYALNTRTGPDDLLRAVRYFDAAIARDSTYARAYSGLSDAWASIANFGYERAGPAFARARAAAARALALDSTLAEARTSLAHTLCTQDHAWTESYREFERAIAEDPSYTYARITYAICLSARERYDEAIAHLDTARKSDPLRPAVGAVLGRVYVNARRPDEAIAALHQAIDLNPQADLAWQQLGHAHLLKGERAEAIAAFQKAAALSGVRDSAHLAYAYAVTGGRDTALRIVRDLVRSSATRYVPPFHVAMAYAGLGDVDEAFRRLEEAYEERASFIGGAKVTAAFAPLHGDPRWARLIEKLGLGP